jgi:opacity protein-like surface antigen
MQTAPNKSAAVATIMLLLLIMHSVANAQVEPDVPNGQPSFQEDTWHVNVSPYLWLAGMNGTVALGAHEAQVNQSFTDIFQNLKFGVMGLSEVHRGRIGILTDLMYIHLGDEQAIPLGGLPNTIDVKTTLNTFTLTPYFAYRIAGNKRGAIDFLTGGRYYHLGAKIAANAGLGGGVSYSASNNWADFVEGGRFTLNVTPRIGAFLLGDAGGGGSVLTWQIATGVGYRWSKRWSTEFGYRKLYFNRQTNNAFGLEQTQQGLILGATFRFK